MRFIQITLLSLFVALQSPLWFGNGSLSTVWRLHDQIDAQEIENARLAERNKALIAQVVDLKHGLDGIEERARAELGMVKENETFFHVVESPTH
ncbi:MAG: cell division protein FtsB [Gammaproteobacteria bacterium]|jgi:cell division protein FtsB|nr:cell division protein FtsB [Pseudomonadota bacterium]MCZ6733223.1 cell division protein FtsB [Gammaproteobacteria bacterium]